MAKERPLEENQLILGEKHEGMNYTARTYFFYTTPTGLEQPLKNCPFVRVLWSRGGNQQPDGTRISEMCFVSTQPIILKMVCMYTAFGNPMNRKFLYLNIDPDAPRVKIVGVGGFGQFTGRATINLELTQLDMKVIKENFSIETLSAPLVESNKEVRSIFY